MKINFSRPITLLVLLPLVLSLSGLGCKGGDKTAQEQLAKPVKLEWWRVEDERDNVAQLIDDYKALHPNTTVNYRKLRPEEFEQVTLEALASGTGPDILSLPNSYLRAWQERLAPLPPTLTLPVIEMSGLIKKAPTAVMKTSPTLGIAGLRNNFVDVVAEDALISGQIYGLPLSLDTLLLYYNRDMLNSAEMPVPPSTWTDFKEASQKLTRIDKQGLLLQNGAALGETDNIPYADHLLAALMLQNGTPMLSGDGGRATFDQKVRVGNEEYAPGADALRFYTDFANPTKETYTWSRDNKSAVEALASGKLAFLFSYWRDLATLRSSAPRINLGIANFPQIDQAPRNIYYASYYLETVTKQGTHQTEAWDFIQFITSPAEALKYLQKAKRPTALRQYVKTQLDDLELAIPAKQVLAAKSWYHGFKPKAAQDAFLSMIRQVNGGNEVESALSFGVGLVNQTLVKLKP